MADSKPTASLTPEEVRLLKEGKTTELLESLSKRGVPAAEQGALVWANTSLQPGKEQGLLTDECQCCREEFPAKQLQLLVPSWEGPDSPRRCCPGCYGVLSWLVPEAKRVSLADKEVRDALQEAKASAHPKLAAMLREALEVLDVQQVREASLMVEAHTEWSYEGLAARRALEVGRPGASPSHHHWHDK